MKESSLEKKLKDHVESNGGICLKLSPMHMCGIPDRLCVLPGGRIFFVEVKKPRKGVLSKIQTHVRKKLMDLGAEVHILDSPLQIKTLMLL